MRKTRFLILFLLLVIASMSILSGCGIIPTFSGVVPPDPPATEEPTVQAPSPVFAREVALAYIRAQHPGYAPALDLIWQELPVDNQELVGSSTFEYLSGDWTVRVSFPLVAPDATIYSVRMLNVELGVAWDGAVDARGQVNELSFTAIDP